MTLHIFTQGRSEQFGGPTLNIKNEPLNKKRKKLRE
jgi:hypothetical protein